MSVCSPAGTMTRFSSTVVLDGLLVCGLKPGSPYEDWYGIIAPSLLMCRERLVGPDSTGALQLKQKKKKKEHNKSVCKVQGAV